MRIKQVGYDCSRSILLWNVSFCRVGCAHANRLVIETFRILNLFLSRQSNVIPAKAGIQRWRIGFRSPLSRGQAFGFRILVAVICLFCAAAIAAPPTHTISGYVQTAAASGVEGVSVTGNNGASSAVTGADGAYSIIVPNKWDGTITAAKPGWLITPPSKTYTNVSADITGENYTAYQPKISGLVTKSDGTPLQGATVTANNSGGTATTDETGYYELFVPYNWTGTVSASLGGYSFTDKNYTNVFTDQTNQNFSGFQPTISGSTGVAGASVTVSGVGNIVSTPAYSVTVPYGWSGTITASLTGYNFSESPRSYSIVTANQTNQNFTPFQPTISGTVTKEDGTPLFGVTVTANNGGGAGSTDINGFYQVMVPYNWSGVVTALKIKWNITPDSYAYVNITSDQTGQNFSASYISTIIVKADGTGYVTTIQAAIDIAEDGDIVQVEDGIYRGNGNRDVDFKGNAITVRGNVADPNLVVIDCHGTQAYPHRGFKFVHGEDSNSILEGLTITNGFGPYEDIWGNGTLRSIGGAIYCNMSNPQVINCIVQNNTAVSWGGGIYNSKSILYIRDCIITNNSILAAGTKGGGIYNIDSHLEIINCFISNNFADGEGGGICNDNNCNSIIDNCEIVDNSVYQGRSGGIYNSNSNLTITNCIISSNERGGIVISGSSSSITGCFIENNNNGRGIYNSTNSDSIITNCHIKGNAGGIWNSASAPVIRSCLITDNHCPVHVPGGGILNMDSYPVIEDSDISYNSGDSGGGICNENSDSVINNCIVNNNSAEVKGGGIYNTFSNATILNCTISNNFANSSMDSYSYGGGGICNCDNSSAIINNSIISENSARHGGGIYVYSGYDNSSLTINRCMITNNSAYGNGGGVHIGSRGNAFIRNCVISNNNSDHSSGGGICAFGDYAIINSCTIRNNSAVYGGSGITGNGTINNSIIWANYGSAQVYGTGPNLIYCNVQGGYNGVGNIDIDPLFEADGYHLTTSSPCINAGDPSYIADPNEADIDGGPRVFYGRIDIGADELVVIPTPVISGYVRRTVNNLPVVDVNVVFSDVGSTTTNAEGFFSFDVPVGWSGTMSLSKAGIESKTITFTNVTADTNSTYLVNLTYADGDGSEGNPFQIETAEQLYWLSMQTDHWDKSFVLVNDVDMNDPNAVGFRAIGNWYPDTVIFIPFSGNFDGGGHTIKNLTLTTVWGIDQIGLFGYIQVDSAKTSVIKNVRLVDASVTGQYAFWGSGSLAGRIQGLGSWNVVIENCHSEGGMVDGIKYAGGLIGFAEDNVIVRRCSANTAVQTTNSGGGLVGCLTNSKLQDSLAIADVNSIPFDAGGLVGSIHSGEVSNCYVEGSVRAEDWVGGFVGRSEGGSVNNCYAACDVTVARFSGGFAGYSWDAFPTDFNACFWDTQISGTSDAVGNIEPDPAGVMGKTTAQMQTQSTFTGWDFVDTWAICEGTNYPRLQWQIPAGDWLCPDGVALEDFVFLAGHWLLENCDAGNNYCEGADLDASGSVDLDDILIFCENWLEGI